VNCGPSAVSRRIPGTTPDVDTVMWRAPRPKRIRIRQRRDGLQDPIQVEQRLAHAHEHDVGQAPAAIGASRRAAVADLVDDLGRGQVAAEAELAGRAERAAHGAAALAGDAHGVALAVRAVHPDAVPRAG
jgi:hypothetical protein